MIDNLPDLDCLIASRPRQDAEIVEAMVTVYRAGCYRLACSILRDPDEAEDAIQQAFLSAAVNLERYTPGSDFKAWIYTITMNICRGMLRKRKARQLLNNLLKIEQTQASRLSGPEAQLVMQESTSEVWSAVERLNNKQRLVVVLRFEHNLTVSEISRILSIREKTVYTRLYDAFRKLRGQLGNEMQADWQEEVSWKEVLQ